MITISLPDVSSTTTIQQYYVLWSEGNTGVRLALGPFYMELSGKPVPIVTETLNFGAPYVLPDEESISGQNPVTHLNAKGAYSLLRASSDPYSAFFSECAKIDPYTQGTGMSMSDHLGDFGPYGQAYLGYYPGGSGRLVPPNVYRGYDCFRGNAIYSRKFDSSYGGYANFSGLTTAVSGYSMAGNIYGGAYRRYDQSIMLAGVPLKSSQDNSWVQPAAMESRMREYSGKVVIQDTTSTAAVTYPILFTSPPVVFTSDSKRNALYAVSSSVSAGLSRLVEPEDIFGSLCKEAVQSIRYVSSNNLENASDFRTPQNIVPPLHLLRKIKRGDVKAISEFYLWYKYSFLPTCSDLPELINAASIRKKRYTGNFYRSGIRTRSYVNMGLSQSCVSRASVCFQVDPAWSAKMAMQSWGVDLSISNVWDLVPFSFVFDWFTSTGDCLSNFDYEFDVFSNTYDFDYINCSNKVTAAVPPIYGLGGGATLSLYRRFPLRSVPFSYERQSSTVSSHILELGALIVTK